MCNVLYFNTQHPTNNYLELYKSGESSHHADRLSQHSIRKVSKNFQIPRYNDKKIIKEMVSATHFKLKSRDITKFYLKSVVRLAQRAITAPDTKEQKGSKWAERYHQIKKP